LEIGRNWNTPDTEHIELGISDCIRGREPQRDFGSFHIGKLGILFALKFLFRSASCEFAAINLQRDEQSVENSCFCP